jgi:queuosine biosynthesis protein QueD
MILRKTFRFEASHILPKHPGKCSRLHGHSWVLHVEVEGPVNPATGFVMDYADISMWVKPIIESLDHRHLGAWAFQDSKAGEDPTLRFEVFEDPEKSNVENLPLSFYPSSENLLHWIGYQLIEFRWSKLAIEETCTSYAELSRSEFDATRNQS